MGPGDEAVGEFVGTLLLVGAVVILGGALAIVLTSTLETNPPPAASLALAGVEPGDTVVSVVYRAGGPLDLDDLRVTVSRNGSGAFDVPRGSWITPSSDTLSPGETLSVMLSPAMGQDERIVVRVSESGTNALLAELGARTPHLAPLGSPLGAPRLNATATPSAIVADASTASRLEVRVSHPAGVLAIASMTADLRNLTNYSSSAASLLALGDAGGEGDSLGGDGVWSALLRAPVNTSVGRYNVTINATDITGRNVASTTVSINITGSLGAIASALGNLSLSNATGNFTGTQLNGTGNFSGNCYGCLVVGGVVSFEGTRLTSPPSANITELRMRNFTWDRSDPDRIINDAGVVRIVGNTYSWSAWLQFGYVNNNPVVLRMTFWDTNRTTVYTAQPGHANVSQAGSARGVNLNNLDLNVNNPTIAGFRCDSGCVTQATYANANIQGEPVFFIAWLRDETNNFQADEIGIISIDAVIR